MHHASANPSGGRWPPSIPRYRVTEFHTQSGLIDRLLRTERLLGILSGAFGAVALTLSAIGLGGLLVYGVARRTNEIGVRIALGAAAGDIIRMVVRDSHLDGGDWRRHRNAVRVCDRESTEDRFVPNRASGPEDGRTLIGCVAGRRARRRLGSRAACRQNRSGRRAAREWSSNRDRGIEESRAKARYRTADASVQAFRICRTS